MFSVIATMIFWIFLTLAFTMIETGQGQGTYRQPKVIRTAPVVIKTEQGQETYPQPKVIRTAPLVIPCLECLKNSGMDLASAFIPPPACNCGGAPDQGEDGESRQPSIQLGPSEEATGYCSCGCNADTVDTQNPNVGPSFSSAMLAPLASVLTSFMRGLNNGGDEAVTITFDDQTSSSNPSEQYPPGGPQCEIPPLARESVNESTSSTTTPITPPLTSSQPQLRFGSCQCYRKARKGVSDIEEDSLYAITKGNPAKKCSCNSYMNHAGAFSQAVTLDSSLPGQSFDHQKVEMNKNNIHQHNVQRDNNLIQPPTTGNPEFDSISKLSAWFSAQKHYPAMSSNDRQSLIPCQGCC